MNCLAIGGDYVAEHNLGGDGGGADAVLYYGSATEIKI